MIYRKQASLLISTNEDVNYSVTLGELAEFIARVNKDFNTPGNISETQAARISIVKSSDGGETHMVISMESEM